MQNYELFSNWQRKLEVLTQYNKQMTQKDIAAYYEQLTRGEKGRFTAFISLRLGGSPHSWQHRLLCVARNTAIRPLSPVIIRELCTIIRSNCWRTEFAEWSRFFPIAIRYDKRKIHRCHQIKGWHQPACDGLMSRHFASECRQEPQEMLLCLP